MALSPPRWHWLEHRLCMALFASKVLLFKIVCRPASCVPLTLTGKEGPVSHHLDISYRARVDYSTEALKYKHDQVTSKTGNWDTASLALVCFLTFSSGLLAQNTNFPLRAMRIANHGRGAGSKEWRECFSCKLLVKRQNCQEHLWEWDSGSTHWILVHPHSPTCSSVPSAAVKRYPQMDGLVHPLENSLLLPKALRTTCLLFPMQ